MIDRERIYKLADEHLKKVGLDLSSRTPTDRLSIAQKQLVEIARALSAGARIIIMDEPTSSLTLTETRRLLSLISELKTHGVSVIYISHRLDEVQQVADRVVGLRDGNAGELARGYQPRRMVRLMVGPHLKDFMSPREWRFNPKTVVAIIFVANSQQWTRCSRWRSSWVSLARGTIWSLAPSLALIPPSVPVFILRKQHCVAQSGNCYGVYLTRRPA
jgi:ribose transport system ATP-binding protein